KVLGRVLVQGSVEGDSSSRFDTRIAPLVGDWVQGARVACQAVFPSSGPVELEVRGAGIDLQNAGLVGAFRKAFASESGGRGLDLGALSVAGGIDFAAEVRSGVYRV